MASGRVTTKLTPIVSILKWDITKKMKHSAMFPERPRALREKEREKTRMCEDLSFLQFSRETENAEERKRKRRT